MHLAIDASGIKHSGGATVLLDFLGAALADRRIDRISVFAAPRGDRTFDFPDCAWLRVYEEGLPERSYVYRILWWESRLGTRCQRLGVDRLLCLSGAGRSARPGAHTTLIQQALPFSLEYAGMMTAAERIRYGLLRLMMERSCQSAHRVIVQSTTMKAWVSAAFRLYPDHVVVITPSATIPVSGETPPLSRHTGSRQPPLLLYVGSAGRHKNLGNLLAGMQLLWERQPTAKLLMTLRPDEVNLTDSRIICRGRVPVAELQSLYAAATLLVMPSLVETVGLPGLEAMALGTPVLAADRPYAHDMYQNAAGYFDPLDPRSLADAADALLRNPDTLAEMSRIGLEITAKRQKQQPYSQMVSVVIE